MLWNRIHGPYACYTAADHLQYSAAASIVVEARAAVYSGVVRDFADREYGDVARRFVIVVVSLTRDFVPSSWAMYYPTKWDWATYLGTFGLFFLFFLFIRFFP